jgi:hypothetical protein
VRQRFGLSSSTDFHTYAYAQFDPCRSSFKAFTVATSIRKLLDVRDPNDHALRAVLGCNAAKVRMLTRALYVTTEQDAATAVRSSPDLINTAIIEVPSEFQRPAEDSSPPTDLPGSVVVTEFGANGLTAKARVTNRDGAWLIYSDAYDPRWRAWVNDAPTPIWPAYIGLKVLRVPSGDSTVRLEFGSSATIAMSVLAVGGAACSLSLLIYCVWCSIRGFPSSRAV